MEKPNKNTENESKPVGYGSSIQSSGHGNQTRPQDPSEKEQTAMPENEIQKKDTKAEE